MPGGTANDEDFDTINGDAVKPGKPARSDRPYRRALSVDEAVHEILAAGGTQLDPAIADAFAALCAERSGAWPIAQGNTDVD